MASLTMKRGDMVRRIEDTISFAGSPVDVTDCSVRFTMKNRDTGVVVSGAAVVSDPVAGRVSYEFTAEQTAVAGIYDFEWELTFPGGRLLTVPDDGYHKLIIMPDLD